MSVEALHEQFVGKTVMLQSGSPLMTVDAVIRTTTGPKLDCYWFHPKGSTTIERATLNPDSVRLDGGAGFDAVTI